MHIRPDLTLALARDGQTARLYVRTLHTPDLMAHVARIDARPLDMAHAMSQHAPQSPDLYDLARIARQMAHDQQHQHRPTF